MPIAQGSVCRRHELTVRREASLGAMLILAGLPGCDAFAAGNVVGTGGELLYPPSGGGFGVGGSTGGVISIGTGAGPAGEDHDGDGLATQAEVLLGLDPQSADTDGDGCSDYFDSVFSDCDGDAITGEPYVCDNLWRAVVFESFPFEVRDKVVRFEAAWFSGVDGGLGGADGSIEWQPTDADGEPVVLIDDRQRAVAFPLHLPPVADERRNAADVDILRFLIRALDASSNEELFRWVVYQGFGNPCTIP
jgi:hypothetical protein